jgi:hypothetical protein
MYPANWEAGFLLFRVVTSSLVGPTIACQPWAIMRLCPIGCERLLGGLSRRKIDLS